jgi:hypothetical protein
MQYDFVYNIAYYYKNDNCQFVFSSKQMAVAVEETMAVVHSA